MYIYIYIGMCVYVLYNEGKNSVMVFFSAIGFIYIYIWLYMCVYAFVNWVEDRPVVDIHPPAPIPSSSIMPNSWPLGADDADDRWGTYHVLS